MKHCDSCRIEIEGQWGNCPLCGEQTRGVASPEPLPAVPLKFSRKRVWRALFASSLAVIVLSFVAQLLFGTAEHHLGVLRSVWLGVTAMWLVVLMAVRKRHNIAKGTVYLVVLVGLVCVYWDFLNGWRGWSVSWAVPIVCAASIVALLITVSVMRVEAGEHIVYSALTVLLGLVPVVFLVFGWAQPALPSAICAIVAVLALLYLQYLGGSAMRHELSKRLHL